MAAEKSTGRPLGATGETVRKNIRRIRDLLGVSAPELSEHLTRLGRPIPPLGISRIENGQRRVDVDDLMAIAAALQVSPPTLLMPLEYSDKSPVGPKDVVSMTGHHKDMHASMLWDWVTATRPLHTTGLAELFAFGARAWPTWVLKKVEEDYEADQARRVSSHKRGLEQLSGLGPSEVPDDLQRMLDGDD